jgi:hypothetical protein
MTSIFTIKYVYNAHDFAWLTFFPEPIKTAEFLVHQESFNSCCFLTGLHNYYQTKGKNNNWCDFQIMFHGSNILIKISQRIDYYQSYTMFKSKSNLF